jgi:hypothetical protein
MQRPLNPRKGDTMPHILAFTLFFTLGCQEISVDKTGQSVSEKTDAVTDEAGAASNETIDTPVVDEEETAETSAAVQTLTLSGTLLLATTVNPSHGDELTPGDSIPLATVFVKGFPDQTAESDALGNFSLALDLSGADAEGLSLEEGAQPTIYKVITWYKTTGKNSLFGANTDIEVAEDVSTKDLETVHLDYTNAVHFTMKDNGTKATVTSTCSLNFTGYGDKIPTVVVAPGKIDSSYMPPDTYEVTVSCTGYLDYTFSFDVLPANSLDAWMSQEVLLNSI